MKRIPKHIYVDYSVQPARLWCKHCGEHRALQLPATIEDAIKQGEAFAESHKYCKNERKKEAKWKNG